MIANLLMRIKITIDVYKNDINDLESLINDNYFKIYDYSNLSLYALGLCTGMGINSLKH